MKNVRVLATSEWNLIVVLSKYKASLKLFIFAIEREFIGPSAFRYTKLVILI